MGLLRLLLSDCVSDWISYGLKSLDLYLVGSE